MQQTGLTKLIEMIQARDYAISQLEHLHVLMNSIATREQTITNKIEYKALSRSRDSYRQTLNKLNQSIDFLDKCISDIANKH